MLQPGAHFAGYTIERRLGVGGMGEVYVARHPRLPRSDALKVLAAQFSADDQFRRRFEREGDVVAEFFHPGIVKVLDRGETDGRLWLALELVDGHDLGQLAQRWPHGMAAPEVGRIVSSVADALDYAAARGLVHRDVKPANVLVDAGGRVMLSDFGIARTMAEVSDLTGTGMTIGTVSYASPEQLNGDRVDGRSDQYSLAATAFHLLTGRPPFVDANIVKVITAHMNQPVPSVRTMRPDLSPGVDAVLSRALAKNPGQRFATSTEFAQALGAELRGDSFATRPATSGPLPAAPVAMPSPAPAGPPAATTEILKGLIGGIVALSVWAIAVIGGYLLSYDHNSVTAVALALALGVVVGVAKPRRRIPAALSALATTLVAVGYALNAAFPHYVQYGLLAMLALATWVVARRSPVVLVVAPIAGIVVGGAIYLFPHFGTRLEMTVGQVAIEIVVLAVAAWVGVGIDRLLGASVSTPVPQSNWSAR